MADKVDVKKFLDHAGLSAFLTKVKEWVNGVLPTKTSELTNDSGFITQSQVKDSASATTPKMNGTAAVGTEGTFARGDHVHPSDSTKVDKVSGKGLSTNDYTTVEKEKLSGIAAGANKYVLPAATSSALGGVKTGTNIKNTSGTISVADASSSAKGVTMLSTNIGADSSSDAKAATPKAVAAYVTNAMATPIKFGGSVKLADIPAMPTDAQLNMLYNMSESFTTTSAFVEGAGNAHPAGSNIMAVDNEGTIKYDVLSGFVDYSQFAKSADYVAITTEEIDALFV